MIHVFGCQPKSPNALTDPVGFAAERDRLHDAYNKAYRAFFRDYLPENGVPARFTVYLIEVARAAVRWAQSRLSVASAERWTSHQPHG